MGIRPLVTRRRAKSRDGRVYYRFWAEMPALLPADGDRQVRRLTWDDYTYRNHTRRFPQDTDWPAAAAELSYWTRLGPGIGTDGITAAP